MSLDRMSDDSLLVSEIKAIEWQVCWPIWLNVNLFRCPLVAFRETNSLYRGAIKVKLDGINVTARRNARRRRIFISSDLLPIARTIWVYANNHYCLKKLSENHRQTKKDSSLPNKLHKNLGLKKLYWGIRLKTVLSRKVWFVFLNFAMIDSAKFGNLDKM